MPCAIRPPKLVVAAKASSRWTGLSSPVTAAKACRSDAATSRAISALCPTLRSSRNNPFKPPPSALLACLAGLPGEVCHGVGGMRAFHGQQRLDLDRIKPAVTAHGCGAVNAPGDEQYVQSDAVGALHAVGDA